MYYIYTKLLFISLLTFTITNTITNLVSSKEVCLPLPDLAVDIVVKVFVHTIADVCVAVVIVTLVGVLWNGPE